MKLEKQLVIVNEFKQVTPRAMTRKILSEHLGTRRNAWNAPKSFGVDDLIALLRENDIMGIAEISSEHYGSTDTVHFRCPLTPAIGMLLLQKLVSLPWDRSASAWPRAPRDNLRQSRTVSEKLKTPD